MGWLIEMVSKDPDLEVNNATLVLRLDDRNTPNILLECFMSFPTKIAKIVATVLRLDDLVEKYLSVRNEIAKP